MHRFDLDLTQMNVTMGEAKFFCGADHFIGDRNLRYLEDVLRHMPDVIAGLRRRVGGEAEAPSKRARVENGPGEMRSAPPSAAPDRAPSQKGPASAPDRVPAQKGPAVAPDSRGAPTNGKRNSDGVLSLSPQEWIDLQKSFSVIVERRKGTPKDICDVCALSEATVSALMREARFSCQMSSLMSLNNLARLHDLICTRAGPCVAAATHREEDMKTLSLRPADGWARVLARLKGLFAEAKTTPAVC